MGALIDLSGQRFSRLTVVNLHSLSKKTLWNCICICGQKCIIEAYSLKTGGTKSCGCLRSEVTKNNKTTHGLRHNPIYDIWCHIKDRCLNEKNPSYHNYGGRGIKICDEWLNSELFIKWCMLNGWQKGLDIDRKDNDGDYQPSNCRITTRRINSFNRRTNVIFFYNNEHYTTYDLEKISNGISSNRILRRIRDYGWSVEEAITIPLKNRKRNQ